MLTHAQYLHTDLVLGIGPAFNMYPLIHSHQPQEIGINTFTIPIFQMRKLRPREVKQIDLLASSQTGT